MFDEDEARERLDEGTEVGWRSEGRSRVLWGVFVYISSMNLHVSVLYI